MRRQSSVRPLALVGRLIAGLGLAGIVVGLLIGFFAVTGASSPRGSRLTLIGLFPAAGFVLSGLVGAGFGLGLVALDRIESKTARPPAKPLRRWRVVGADRATGKTTRGVYTASTAGEAERLAAGDGVLIERVEEAR